MNISAFNYKQYTPNFGADVRNTKELQRGLDKASDTDLMNFNNNLSRIKQVDDGVTYHVNSLSSGLVSNEWGLLWVNKDGKCIFNDILTGADLPYRSPYRSQCSKTIYDNMINKFNAKLAKLYPGAEPVEDVKLTKEGRKNLREEINSQLVQSHCQNIVES